MSTAIKSESLKDKIARLKAEKEAALAEFTVQSFKLNFEFASQIFRFKKQKCFLYKCYQKMIAYSLNSINKLDALKKSERQERLKQEEAERQAAVSSPSLLEDPPPKVLSFLSSAEIPISSFFLDPSLDPSDFAALAAFDPSDFYQNYFDLSIFNNIDKKGQGSLNS